MRLAWPNIPFAVSIPESTLVSIFSDEYAPAGLTVVSTVTVPATMSHKCVPPVDAPPASRKVILGMTGVEGLALLDGDCECDGLMDALGLRDALGLTLAEPAVQGTVLAMVSA